jgi:hypothetical protein
MLAGRLSALGLSDNMVKGVIVIVLAAVSGVLVAVFPAAPWVPPIAAAVTALAALIDPNATH